MKKLLILQIEDKALGGVWYVNKTLSEELLKHKYDVRIVSIRERHDGPKLDINPKVTMTTINPVDNWQIVHRHDIIDAIKTFNIKDEELDSMYINMDFLGLNLAQVPTQSKDWKVYIIPILYVLVAVLSMKV